MSHEDNKELEMAVGTSNILESSIMDGGENFYTPVESATEPEPASGTSWNPPKNDTGQLCRSCANSSDYLIPIFEGEGLEHQLEYKIQKHLPIQVSSTDTLPLQLCYQCASTLIAWDSMINSCIEADKKLRAMQEAAEDMKRIQVYDDKTDMDVETGADPDSVDSDDEPLITSRNKLLLEKAVASKDATPLKKKILSKAKSKSATPTIEKTVELPKDGEDKERYVEDNLNNRHEESKEIASKGDEKNQKFPCIKCGKILAKKISLRNHMRTHESANTGKSRYDYALTISNGKKRYKCDKCGKYLLNHRTFRRHLDVHTTEKDFNCGICCSRFRTTTLLRRHVNAVHEKIKTCTCELCGKSFSEIRLLENHKRIHTGERPFVCETCDKTFSDPSTLYAHKKTHTRNYTLCCQICSKFFPSKTHLERHLRYHRGEKKYPCEICKKKFRDVRDVKRHRIIHYSVTVHVCDVCNSQYKALRSLKKHKQRFHTTGS